MVPITIRQLEALVRLSESLAKMRQSAVATTSDVREALRLFRVSTLAAELEKSEKERASSGGSSSDTSATVRAHSSSDAR